jgi:NADPH:quinone reductase-like Zn-dependent oxidoreductase
VLTAVDEATGGRGADVVLDHAGGRAAGLELLRPGSIVATRPEIERVIELAKLGRLTPVIAQTYALDEIAEAHRRLADRAISEN